MAAPNPPPISHILETCLYVRDVSASAEFYKSLLCKEPYAQSPRSAGFDLGSTTLLLFQLGQTSKDITTPNGGVIPAHGPSDWIISSLRAESQSNQDDDGSSRRSNLKQHFCFAVDTPADVEQWDAHLRKLGVPISGRIDWERGGKSVYFEDLDGHVGEVGSKGIWKHY